MDGTGLDKLPLFATPKQNKPEKKEKKKKRTAGMGSKDPGSDICRRGINVFPQTDSISVTTAVSHAWDSCKVCESAQFTSHSTARVLCPQRLYLHHPCSDFETRRGVIVGIGDRRIETAERAFWIHHPLHILLRFASSNRSLVCTKLVSELGLILSFALGEGSGEEDFTSGRTGCE